MKIFVAKLEIKSITNILGNRKITMHAKTRKRAVELLGSMVDNSALVDKKIPCYSKICKEMKSGYLFVDCDHKRLNDGNKALVTLSVSESWLF